MPQADSVTALGLIVLAALAALWLLRRGFRGVVVSVGG